MNDMKILALSIILSISLLAPLLFGVRVNASCIEDIDWAEKPCLDTPPYSDSELKQFWEPYYQMKGKDWMEMKKAEMETSIKDGTLKEWVEYGSSSNNSANYNVWFYYHLYGQAPDLEPYYGGNVIKDDLKPIVSYYYTNPAGLALIGIVSGSIGIAGFFVGRKILSKNRKRE